MESSVTYFLRVAKRRPCFRTQRVTRLYLQPVTPVQGTDGEITGKQKKLCHTRLLSFIDAFFFFTHFFIAIWSRFVRIKSWVHFVQSRVVFFVCFFLDAAPPNWIPLWEMLWVIPARRGLTNPTVCEGRAPVKGFTGGLSKGTFCCCARLLRLSASQSSDLRHF